MRLQSHTPHAIRRAVDWRTPALRLGAVLCIGGAMVFVSTPAAGGVVFALGLLALIAGATE